MWISKEELACMKTRLRELEHTVAKLEYDTQVWIKTTPRETCDSYGRPLIIGEFRRTDNILLPALIQKIIDHLKLKIEYQQPQKQEQFILKKK